MSRESENPREPITDSGWFWLFVFGGAALVALAAIGPKYLRRQASIERQYYARETIVAREAERQITAAREAERQITAARQAAQARSLTDSGDSDQPRAEGRAGQAAETGAGQNAPAVAPPSRLIIPLGPLAAVIVGLLVLAAIARAVLIRQRRARAALADRETTHQEATHP